jgi:hypothetical protein
MTNARSKSQITPIPAIIPIDIPLISIIMLHSVRRPLVAGSRRQRTADLVECRAAARQLAISGSRYFDQFAIIRVQCSTIRLIWSEL